MSRIRYKECYRKLLKSTIVAFRNDTMALQRYELLFTRSNKNNFHEYRSRELLRTEFIKNKDVHDVESLNKMYADVDDVDEMLRYNLVQGHRQTPTGSFGTRC